QEVKTNFNLQAETINPGGMLTELTVPYSRPFSYSTQNGWRAEDELRLYFGSVHWVTDIVEGIDKNPWYEITDELYAGFTYYVPVEHLRPIPAEEVTPLSPDVPAVDKRIEVSLTWQILTAYEGEDIVMRTQVSTGIGGNTPAGQLPTKTPVGTHNIYSKMPSKHMGLGRLTDTLGDRALPGVPWTSFFAAGGYAIHGAYWHNNFGWPMSRGCINMRTDEAKWLFRWLTPAWQPAVVSDRDWEVRGRGTKLIVME
ncbi:MAG: L,D-transpeptidase, partial [Chloroflexota bacterium]